MPIVFLFSAIVSGIAAVLLLYMALSAHRRVAIDMRCLDTIARYLFFAFLIDFSLELLDLIHRLYEADESLRALDFMVKTRLFTSQIVVQILSGNVPSAFCCSRSCSSRGSAARARVAHLLRRRRAHAHRDLRHALECRDWRSAVLQELPRIHELQTGIRDAGRPPASGDLRRAAAGHPRRADSHLPAVAG